MKIEERNKWQRFGGNCLEGNALFNQGRTGFRRKAISSVMGNLNCKGVIMGKKMSCK